MLQLPFTQKEIKPFLCKDKISRQGLRGVLYDADKEKLVATNTHIMLIIHDVKQQEQQFTGKTVLPLEAFPEKKGYITEVHKRTTPEGIIFQVREYSKEKSNVEQRRILEQFPELDYPNYESVIPDYSFAKELSVIGFDFALFQYFVPLMNNTITQLKFHGESSAISFDFEIKEYKATGLIMPYCLEDTEDIQNHKRAAIKNRL